MRDNRTTKSIKNSTVALVMYFVNLTLQFYSRKVFLDYLGTEIIGLNSTALNILQFLNLAELGVWSAIATSLYKPLHNKDFDRINKIITFNGIIYRRIGCTILLVAIITMCFFPQIFKKMDLPLWYAYASFGALLYSSLLGYFVNYKQFLLSSDQKDYKIQYSYKLCMSLKIVCQIIAMYYFEYPYVWWLICEVIFASVGAYALNFVIKQTYPFLRTIATDYKTLKGEFPEIVTKIKQLFVQKISGFVLFQTSPIIIYSFSSLTLVALYSNYLLIIQGLISLMAAIFNSLLAGIGNLIASSSFKHILEVFKDLLYIRYFITGILSYGAWCFSQDFVAIWIGKEFILPYSTLAIMVLTFFFYVNRYLVYDFLTAYGYFGDYWASIIEVILNIGLSIFLGVKFGLNGILSGVLISLIIISCLWKPIYLFKFKLHINPLFFYKEFLKLTIILSFCIGGTEFIKNISLSLYPSNITITIVLFTIFLIAYTSIMLLFNDRLINVLGRIINSRHN